MSIENVVVVGAGQAGLQVAASLRDEGFAGSITLLGDEPVAPYQRPPLSKAYLLGDMGVDGLPLRADAFYAEKAIALRLGVRAGAIDRAAMRVLLADGGSLPYDRLVLATGARSRALACPGADLPGVLPLRTLADADALAHLALGAKRVVVAGAGFIGLEFAAVAAKRGIGVDVVEPADRPMARAVSEPMSSFFRRFHEATGVRFHFGSAIAALEGETRVTAAVTTAGATLEAEVVLVGIGVIANAEIAAEAGLAVANGIVVDEFLTTGDPAILAIGDCAVHPSRYFSRPVRIESVQNAVDQGRAAARVILGRPEPYAAVPWFWSDQGPYKLQMVGLSDGRDRTVVRGDPDEGKFSVFAYAGDRLVGVESVNAPADHMIGRRLIAAGTSPDPEAIADPAFDLRALGGGARPRR